MDRAVEAFENDFARWDLHLPPDALEARRAGQIKHAGWSIRFNFGRDARGDYLDYYASPRDVVDDPPSDDWHVRLYASGERLSLPTVLEAYMYGRDPTWEELERARRPFAGEPSETPAADSPPEDEAPVSEALPKMGSQAAKPQAAPGPRAMPKPPIGRSNQTADATPPSGSDQSVGLTDAPPDSTRPYLPIDIGLDIELNLSPPAGAARSEAPEPGVADDEPPPADLSEAEDGPEEGAPQLPERYYAAEETDSFIQEKAERNALSTLPLLDVGEDDRPAPITLAPLLGETGTSAPWHHGAVELAAPAGESESKPAQGKPHDPDPHERQAAPAETRDLVAVPQDPTDSIPIAEHDEGAPTLPSGDAPADNHDAGEGSSTVPTWESEFPEAAALTGPIRSRPKVFQRADLVLTADVAAIDANFDSNSFLPWWHRPGPRRIAVAAAAVIVVLLIAFAVTHHRSRSSAGQDEADGADSSAIAAPTPGAAGDSAGGPSPDTVTQSQPAPIPSMGNAPADSSQRAIESPAAAPQAGPTPEVGYRGSDDGMARPAGPQSISPIVPSANSRSHGTPVRSLQGSFPRGNSP